MYRATFYILMIFPLLLYVYLNVKRAEINLLESRLGVLNKMVENFSSMGDHVIFKSQKWRLLVLSIPVQINSIILSCSYMQVIFLLFQVLSFELLVNNKKARKIENVWKFATGFVPTSLRNLIRKASVVCFFLCQFISFYIDFYEVTIS